MSELLDSRDEDRVRGVFAQGIQVARIAGQDQSARPSAGDRGNHRVDGRNGPGAPSCCPEPGRLPGLGLVDISDLTRAEQTVDMEVATLIPGERLGKDDRGHLRRPPTPTLQLLETCTLLGE